MLCHTRRAQKAGRGTPSMTHDELTEKMAWGGKVLVGQAQGDFTRGAYDDTINLIRTTEMGAGVARALGPRRAVLLKNHGVVVTGVSIEEVVISTIMLESAAQIQLIAEAAGTPAPEFPLADIKKLQHDISRPEQFAINFDYLVRREKRRGG